MNDVRQRVENGLAKARELSVAANIAIVDAGGHLLCFVRMDDALLGSVDLALRKARTSVLFRTESGALGRKSQPGGGLWSIENSNGGLVTFGGGVPLFDGDGRCIGAAGVSGGTVEQDEQIARSCTLERRATVSAKRVLITGAGSGFGRDSALRLAEHGHQVIAGVQFEKQISELKQLAANRGLEIRAEKLDLLSESDREAAFQWKIDVLVNNAGMGEGGPIAEIPVELVRKVFEVNVFSTLALTQSFVKQMVKRGSGRVIFVSSIAGLVSGAYLGAYTSSKHALEAIAESLGAELAPHGIQVATLNPGPYETGFNERMIQASRRWYDPERNFTRPEDLARLSQRFEKQFDPDEIVQAMVALVEGDSGRFRNVLPRESEDYVKKIQEEAWTRVQTAPLFAEKARLRKAG